MCRETNTMEADRMKERDCSDESKKAGEMLACSCKMIKSNDQKQSGRFWQARELQFSWSGDAAASANSVMHPSMDEARARRHGQRHGVWCDVILVCWYAAHAGAKVAGFLQPHAGCLIFFPPPPPLAFLKEEEEKFRHKSPFVGYRFDAEKKGCRCERKSHLQKEISCGEKKRQEVINGGCTGEGQIGICF